MSTLSDLFARDPLALTRTDLDEIVAYYRAHRDHFKEIKKTGERKKVRVKKAAKKAKVDPAQADLEELIAEKEANT